MKFAIKIKIPLFRFQTETLKFSTKFKKHKLADEIKLTFCNDHLKIETLGSTAKFESYDFKISNKESEALTLYQHFVEFEFL